jgi:hypothetical protein
MPLPSLCKYHERPLQLKNAYTDKGKPSKTDRNALLLQASMPLARVVYCEYPHISAD